METNNLDVAKAHVDSVNKTKNKKQTDKKTEQENSVEKDIWNYRVSRSVGSDRKYRDGYDRIFGPK